MACPPPPPHELRAGNNKFTLKTKNQLVQLLKESKQRLWQPLVHREPC